MVLRTFETEKEKYNQFKALCTKEGVDVGKKLNEFIDSFIKEHGDGNPHSTLDQFTNNQDFFITPAVFRKPEDIRKWLQQIRKTKDWQKLGVQLQKAWVEQYNELDVNAL